MVTLTDHVVGQTEVSYWVTLTDHVVGQSEVSLLGHFDGPDGQSE